MTCTGDSEIFSVSVTLPDILGVFGHICKVSLWIIKSSSETNSNLQSGINFPCAVGEGKCLEGFDAKAMKLINTSCFKPLITFIHQLLH